MKKLRVVPLFALLVLQTTYMFGEVQPNGQQSRSFATHLGSQASTNPSKLVAVIIAALLVQPLYQLIKERVADNKDSGFSLQSLLGYKWGTKFTESLQEAYHRLQISLGSFDIKVILPTWASVQTKKKSTAKKTQEVKRTVDSAQDTPVDQQNAPEGSSEPQDTVSETDVQDSTPVLDPNTILLDMFSGLLSSLSSSYITVGFASQTSPLVRDKDAANAISKVKRIFIEASLGKFQIRTGIDVQSIVLIIPALVLTYGPAWYAASTFNSSAAAK